MALTGSSPQTSPSDGGPASHPLVTLSLLPLAIGAILITTAIPIELGSTAGLRPKLGIIDFIDNLILYAPLGVAMARSPATVVLLVSGLLSAGIEITQIWSIGRFPSWYDIIANGLGALAAALLWKAWRKAEPTTSVVVPVGRGLLATVGIAAAALLALWAIPPQSSAITGWIPDYALMLGDERSHDRPWLGTITEAVLVPGALPRDVARTLGRDGRSILEGLRGSGAIELVTSPLITDGSGPVRIPMSVAEEFGRAAIGANEFSVAVRFTPALASQDGPARIVSYSAGILRRNFDLGQQDERVTFRVATPVTGENGEEHRVATPPILRKNQEVVVVATYDGKVARVFLDGTLVGRSNLAAAGCAVPVLCGSGLGPGWAGLGGAVALLVLALLRSIAPGTPAMIAAVSSAAGLLALAWATGFRLGPAGDSWGWALAFLGAFIVAIAMRRSAHAQPS